MRPGKLLHLARGNLRRELGPLAVSASGVALGIGCLVFFLALGAGLNGLVHGFFPVSTRELEVVVPQLNLLGDVKLDDAAVARLRKLPGVAEAYPKLSLKIPAVTRYNGLFFGHEIHMGLEVIGVGISPDLVALDARMPFADNGEDKPIPVVVSRRLLELYNKVFAPQRGLPTLTDSMLVGFQFPIELGRSYIAAKTLPNAFSSSFQLVGFSDRAAFAGVSMPIAVVRRLNEKFGQPGDAYSSVLLRAQSSEQMVQVAAGVRRLGFELDESERNRALQISAAVELVTLGLSLLAALITALAAVNTAQAFYASVRERKREIGVLRAVGATKADVAAVLLAEAALTGLAGGIVGVGLARLAALILDRLARTGLPDFPFKPATFFHFEYRHMLLGVLVALAAALVGAFFPARAAARLDPAKALTET